MGCDFASCGFYYWLNQCQLKNSSSWSGAAQQLRHQPQGQLPYWEHIPLVQRRMVSINFLCDRKMLNACRHPFHTGISSHFQREIACKSFALPDRLNLA
jgi:hypothetical protein